MLARLKRRSSLYTLPIVVLIGLTTVAALAAWQRSDIIAELVDQIAHGEKSEATAAVRQLAALSNPPLDVLVDAASSDERATAEVAQVAINRLLSQWKLQVENRQRTGRVTAELNDLATQLATQRRAFAKADHPWLASTTHAIIRLANQCPSKKTPLVAIHCDEILAMIEAAGDADTAAAHASPTTRNQQDSRLETAPSPQRPNQSETTRENLERQFSEFPAPPVAADTSDNSSEHSSTNSAPPPPFTEGAQALPNALERTPSHGADASKQNEPDRQETSTVGDQPPRGDAARGSAWSRPLYRVPPTQSAPPTSASNALRPPKPLPAEAVNAVSSTVPTPELLARWLAAFDRHNEADRLEVETSLATRGFQPVPEKLVRLYLAHESPDRKNVPDQVIAEPTIDSRPWLLLLAADDDVDVRLAAVTMMATSTDQIMVEKALQIAIRDRDPRIADLASRLRERRSQPRRR